MSNKTTLQGHNTRISNTNTKITNNNISLETLSQMIDNLPEAGGGGSTNSSNYVFGGMGEFSTVLLEPEFDPLTANYKISLIDGNLEVVNSTNVVLTQAASYVVQGGGAAPSGETITMYIQDYSVLVPNTNYTYFGASITDMSQEGFIVERV